MAASADDLRLAAVLQQFGVRPEEVEAIGGGFSGACVWRVRTRGDRFMGLRWSPEPLERSELERRESICRWMQFARAAGCEWVPQPFRPLGAVGNFLLTQPDGWWQLETWMPGHPVDTAPSPLQLQQALAAVSRLHQTGRSWALQESPGGGPPGGRRGLAAATSPGLQRRLLLVRELQSGALARLFASAAQDPDGEFRQLSQQLERCLQQRLPGLARHLEELAPCTFSLQPVLRDLWQPHILFSGDQVTGVIDWNAAFSDHPAFDYSRLLASWYGWRALNLLSSAVIPAVGSSAGGHLPVGFQPEHWTGMEHELLRVCVAASLLLSPVTWLHRRCAGGPASQRIRPEVLARYRRLVSLACGTAGDS